MNTINKILLTQLTIIITLIGCSDRTIDEIKGPDLDWTRVKGGVFMMGQAENQEQSNSHPLHEEQIAALDVLKTEVTVKQYNECVDNKICWKSLLVDDLECNGDKADKMDHPINCVNWYQANAFCTWANARLPYEAEWEYIATNANAKSNYPWGGTPASCDFANLQSGDDPRCKDNKTHKVCSHPQGNNKNGICDLIGNVSEWVKDWYHDSYNYNTSSKIQKHRNVNSRDSSHHRVVRGAGNSHARNRIHFEPSQIDTTLGFRCVRDVESRTYRTTYEINVIPKELPKQKVAKQDKPTRKQHEERKPPPPTPANRTRTQTTETKDKKRPDKRRPQPKHRDNVIPSSRISSKNQMDSKWDGNIHMVIPSSGITIEYENIIKHKKIDVALDNNDTYEFEFFLDKKSQGKIKFPSKYNPRGGFSQHQDDLPKEVRKKGFNRIVIKPSGEDNFYSLGHILFQ